MSESSPPAGGSESSPQPPKPSPPKLPPKRDEKADFRVIRSAPPPESGPSMAPVLILVAVIGVGIAGYVLTRDKAATTTTTTTTSTSKAPTTEVATLAPDFVTEKIAFYENEQQFERALKYAEEKLVDYPTAGDLKAKINQLRTRLGLDTLANPDEGLRQIAARIGARQFAEALEKVTALMEGATLSDAQSARAYFLLAACHANLGSALDAANALKAAEDLGYSATECAALREQFKL